MKLVITYLVVMLVLIALSFLGLEQFGLPNSLTSSELAMRCALIAALGGILYCLRSVYLNGADPFLCWFAILSKSNHVRSVYE